MKSVFSAVGFLVAVLLCADKGIAAGPPAGKALYSSRCSGCHGADSKGNAALVKALGVDVTAMDLTKKDVKKRNDKDLSGVIKNGKGKMAAVKGLSNAEIKVLIKHLRSLK